jgi:hypothetical protein
MTEQPRHDADLLIAELVDALERLAAAGVAVGGFGEVFATINASETPRLALLEVTTDACLTLEKLDRGELVIHPDGRLEERQP